jgi:hypothetical protein
VPPGTAVALRFECNPYITKPMTGTGMAQTVPYFLPHVTQFIVEYAGDYITQGTILGADPYPPTAIGPDGQIDFYTTTYVDSGGVTHYQKHIRWYGFPRDTSSTTGGPPDGHIYTYGSAFNYDHITDVLPLRDILLLAGGLGAPPSTFEQEVPALTGGDYAALGALHGPGGAGTAAHYYCVWRNGAPKLVRILMKIDDPTGRAKAGRWVEEVFRIQ